MTTPPPRLALHAATKSFGAVKALEDGTITLYAGEAHALLGENGAGKSTLVKILGGVHRPDGGTLEIDGDTSPSPGRPTHRPPACRSSTRSRRCSRISAWPRTSSWDASRCGTGRRIDRRAMEREAREIFTRLGVQLDPARPARGLSVADQQIVEIAKALSFDAGVLVMDEPTAALTSVEVQRLFDVIETLREQGAAVLFISHRLEEVFACCQRVTIMRDGRFVRTAPVEELSIDDIIRSMVGRDLEALFPKTETDAGRGRARGRRTVQRGRLRGHLLHRPLGRDRRAGGTRGSGRSEVARAIFGIDRRYVRDGHDGRPRTAQRRRACGHGGRHGAGARGPPPAGPGHGPRHRPERRPGLDGAAAAGSG